MRLTASATKRSKLNARNEGTVEKKHSAGCLQHKLQKRALPGFFHKTFAPLPLRALSGWIRLLVHEIEAMRRYRRSDEIKTGSIQLATQVTTKSNPFRSMLTRG